MAPAGGSLQPRSGSELEAQVSSQPPVPAGDEEAARPEETKQSKVNFSTLSGKGSHPASLGSPVLSSDIAKREISKTFRSLIEKIMVQHAAELAELKERLQAMPVMPVVPAVQPLAAEKKSSPSLGPTLEAPLAAGLRMTSEHSAASTASPQQSTKNALKRGFTSGEVMRKHHEGMHQFRASEVIDVFDREELEKLSVEDEDPIEAELNKLRHAEDQRRKFNKRASTTAMTTNFEWLETDSNYQRQLAAMTRFQRMQEWLQSSRFEMLMATVLCLNVLWMAMELQVDGSIAGIGLGVVSQSALPADWIAAYERFFLIGDVAFTVVFTVDVVVRICILGFKFWKVWMNYIDIGVSVASLIEVTFYYVKLPVNPVLFRLLRIGKLARAIRMIHMTNVLASLQLLIKCLAASRAMLFWSFCLLAFFQCVAGMIVSTLCRDFVRDEAQQSWVREEVFRHYGTFSRTFLSMFEILFANWSPPCRILVEHVSEWFSIFFLLYRCVLGFAVLNVVNSVFVQQTMKTASSDDELAFKQKQRDINLYTKKVKKLFSTMDSSGDGAIAFDEFSKLCQSPKLQFWMSQLDLEYHDMLSLFEFLDNGDGRITLSEFIEGAARLRGSAKAIDVWRMETKVELLFEEVLNLLKKEPAGDDSPAASLLGTSNVQDVFDASVFRLSSTGRISNPDEDENDEDIELNRMQSTKSTRSRKSGKMTF